MRRKYVERVCQQLHAQVPEMLRQRPHLTKNHTGSFTKLGSVNGGICLTSGGGG